MGAIVHAHLINPAVNFRPLASNPFSWRGVPLFQSRKTQINAPATSKEKTLREITLSDKGKVYKVSSQKRSHHHLLIMGGSGTYDFSGVTPTGYAVGYLRFARALTETGFNAYLFENVDLSILPEVEGYERRVKRMVELHALVKDKQNSKTIVLGHSLGGLLIGLGASQLKPDAVVLVSTPWAPLSETVESQLRDMLSDEGASEERIASTIVARQKIMRRVRKLDEESQHTRFCQLESWHDGIDRHRLFDEIRCPVLIISGRRDRVVNSSHGKRLYFTLKSRGQEVSLEEFDLAHSFNEEELKDSALKALVGLMKNHINQFLA